MLEGWAGDYYGIPVESTLDAITLTGRLEGMIIDPVYEGKSMAGLIDLVALGRDPQGLHGALRPPRRAAGAQRLLRHLRLSILPTHSSRPLNELDRRVAAKRRSTF